MSYPSNENDTETTRTTELLLSSWRNDHPSKGAKQATLAALGLGIATATAATGAAASVVGGVARGTMIGIVKAVATGALAGAVVVGTSAVIQHAQGSFPIHARSAPAPRSAAPSAPALPTAMPESASPARDPEIEEEQQEQAVAAVPPAAPQEDTSDRTAPVPSEPSNRARAHSPSLALPVAGAAAAPERMSSLARETALLDECRSSLARGNVVAAIALLDRYAADFPNGNLVPEAIVMRIEAYLRGGDDRAARALASQFVAAHPNDSHLARIQSLLAQQSRSQSTGGSR